MRRKEREIHNVSVIHDIIRRCTVCRLAMCENGRPYVVPLCFGYQDNALYFHSAREGRKLEILKKNGNVCFELDIDHELELSDQPCRCGMRYRSVIGFGKAAIVDDPESKRKGLDVLMRHYAEGSSDYSEQALENTVIIRVDIEEMTGKQFGY